MATTTRKPEGTRTLGVPVASSTLGVKNLCIGVEQRLLVDDVSFEVPAGGVVALVGESGSGKTMIGKSVLGLLPERVGVRSGSLLYHGESITDMSKARLRALRGRHIGMVFQEPLVSLNPSMRIGKQMAEGLRLHTDWSAGEIRKRSIEMLRKIRIADPEGCLAAYPHEFSGGMRQRIMLASVMLLKPDLLIADEPTTALDTLSQRDVLETMLELTREAGTAVLLITHNLGLVSRYADQVVVLREGRLVEQGATARVLAAPTQGYTRNLLESVPVIEPRAQVASGVGDAVLEASDIRLSYPGRSQLFGRAPRKQVLRGVSLTVHRGEFVAVVGGSGSGKTTLGRAMLRLASIDSGDVLHKGRNIGHVPQRLLGSFRRSCQIVFQDPFSSLDPRMRVGAIVEEALRHDRALDAATRRARTTQALAEVGLPDHAHRYPHELSGGQRQRVAIARAIVGKPDLIVADEPISALDMTIQKQVLQLFEQLQAQYGFACLFISHDLAAVQQIAQRVVVMHEGLIVEQGTCQQVFANPQHAYTRSLIEASPTLSQRVETRLPASVS